MLDYGVSKKGSALIHGNAAAILAASDPTGYTNSSVYLGIFHTLQASAQPRVRYILTSPEGIKFDPLTSRLSMALC